MRVVAIINQKGGCGKTTTAINLAGALARLGRRVLLIDMDPQSHCAVGLGIPEARIDLHIGDAMLTADERRLDESRLLWRVRKGLELIPSSMRLAGLEAAQGGLFTRPDRDARLKSVISRFQDRFDWALIDCPPSIGLLTFNALRAATEVLIPVEMSYFALRGAERQARTIMSLARRLGGRTPFRMLPTMHRPGDQLAEELLTELRAKFPEHLIPHSIRRDEKLREAASFGQPLVEYDAAAPGAMDYADLAVWLIAHPPLRLRGRAAAGARKMPPPVESGEGFRRIEQTDPRDPDAEDEPLVQPTGGGMDDDLESDSTNADAGVRAMLQSVSPSSTAVATAPPRQAMEVTNRPDPRANGHEAVVCTSLARLEHSPAAFAAAICTPASPAPAPTAPAPTARAFPGAVAPRDPRRAQPAEPTRPAPAFPGAVTPGPAAAEAPEVEFSAPPVTSLSRAAELAAKARRLLAESVALQARLVADPDVRRVRREDAMEAERPRETLQDKLRRIYGARETTKGALFVHPAPAGARVFVAGDFNGWSPTATPLRYNERLGVHETCIQVPQGRRQYRLVVDGRWITDPHNKDVEADVFGEINSVVVVHRAREHDWACEGAD